MDHFQHLRLSLIHEFVHLLLELRLVDVVIVALHREISFLDNRDPLFLAQRVFRLVESAGTTVGDNRLNSNFFDVVISMRVGQFAALHRLLDLAFQISCSRIAIGGLSAGRPSSIHFKFLLASIIVADGLDGLFRREIGRIDILKVPRPLNIPSPLDPAGASTVHYTDL